MLRNKRKYIIVLALFTILFSGCTVQSLGPTISPIPSSAPAPISIDIDGDGWTDPQVGLAGTDIQKMDTASTTWQMTFGGSERDVGYSLQQTSDGGYIIVGFTESYGVGYDDMYLVKTDSSGSMMWDQTFGDSGMDRGYSVQQTSDDGYIIAGVTDSFGAGGNDVYLVKTDSSGSMMWQKTFGDSGHDWGESVQQTSDGGYIIGGITDSFEDSGIDVYLVKTDASGKKMWDQNISGSGVDRGNSVQQTSDGGFIIVGATRSYESSSRDVYLVKTDSEGWKVWEQTFGGSDWDWGNSVQQTSDGGYIIVGYVGTTESYGSADAYLVKTDSSGRKMWEQTFGGSERDIGYSVQQTTDGGYIIGGLTESLGASGIDVYLVKTDSSGRKMWERTFSGSEVDRGNSVQQTSDGGYIIGGLTESSWAGDGDMYLVKTDELGN